MTNPLYDRHFTIEEAEILIELIRPLMAEILDTRAAILLKQPELWPVVEKAAGNGGSKDATRVQRDFEVVDNRIRRILATGALIKDINNGLVDFPSWRDGKEIYLCWKYGEARIQYWHDIKGGFAGRRPI